MTYFRTIKAALDALIAGISQHRAVTSNIALQMAGAHLRNMSQQWRTGQNPTIAYNDPLCRFAYLYCHTAANAAICELFIREHLETTNFIVEKLNQNEELKVCAFGGGPGTELLALTKFLRRKHDQGALHSHGDVNFTLLDNVPEWAESWNALEAAIKVRFSADFGTRRNWPFTVSKFFQPFDMTRVEQYANLNQLFVQDLYILNYVVSEIFSEHDALGNLLNTMAAHAPSGSRFLFIDRNQEQIVQWCRTLLENAGLVEQHFSESSTNMDGDEQSAHLGEYIALVGWNPRVTWNGAFCLIGVKP
jgi:hypothetical protein